MKKEVAVSLPAIVSNDSNKMLSLSMQQCCHRSRADAAIYMGKWFSVRLSPWRLLLFVEPVFLYFFQKCPNTSRYAREPLFLKTYSSGTTVSNATVMHDECAVDCTTLIGIIDLNHKPKLKIQTETLNSILNSNSKPGTGNLRHTCQTKLDTPSNFQWHA